ncbi:MAG: GNAT family N-acetyltransferase [Planctomycetes bacterium]|nr:GNAT family N-acetyltransferase [Planctomycetota bacterium]
MRLPSETRAFLQATDGVELDEGDRLWTRRDGSCRRWPLHLQDPVLEETWRTLFRRGKHAIAWAVEEPRADRPPTGCWYVCRDREFDLGKLSANTRSKVRRGRKRFRVEEVPAPSLLDQGWKAKVDTWGRFGFVPDRKAFERMCRHACESNAIRVLAALGVDHFSAWVAVLSTGDGHDIYDLASTNASLRDYPNNALFYVLLRRLLADEGSTRVDFGVSSLQPRSHVDTLHQFKLSMGFEAVPIHRAIRFHPLLAPLTTGPARMLVRAVANAFPSSISMQKLWGALECYGAVRK